ncbi:MAG: HAD-IA family hydrolase, partial [Bacteroidales bacterium]|nr:HAD-IA family hydrolase [Bacteroidales bacterium]
DKYFNYFFSSKDLGYSKPDVRFFKLIAQRIGIAPESCAMIGNIYDKDITGAKECGMLTIFFNEKNIKGEFPKADIIIQDMNSFPDVFHK